MKPSWPCGTWVTVESDGDVDVDVDVEESSMDWDCGRMACGG